MKLGTEASITNSSELTLNPAGQHLASPNASAMHIITVTHNRCPALLHCSCPGLETLDLSCFLVGAKPRECVSLSTCNLHHFEEALTHEIFSNDISKVAGAVGPFQGPKVWLCQTLWDGHWDSVPPILYWIPPAVPHTEIDKIPSSHQYVLTSSSLLGISKYLVLSSYCNRKLFSDPLTSLPAVLSKL